MDDREVIKNLLNEFICSICLQYFRFPVTIGCGHSFCQMCLRQWGKYCIPFSCPECREVLQLREYKPTISLLNQVNIIRLVEPYLFQNPEERTICERHQKAQKLFCFEDETPICVSCLESQEHEDHALCPIWEVVEYYKKKHWDHQNSLWKRLEYLQKALSKEKKRCLSWCVAWTVNIQKKQKKLKAMLEACIPAVFESSTEAPEEEEEQVEELLELEPQESEPELQESEPELQESELELESELDSEEDEEVENGLQMLSKQEMEVFQQLKKREAKEISKIFKQRKEWEAKLEQYIRDLQEMLTELEQKCKKSNEELLQGVTDRLRRSETLLLRGWESFSPKLSRFYLIMVAIFLLKFQESPQVKNSKFYEFSEDKKRYIIFMPDCSSREIHAIYTIFNSKECQKFISQNLIYFHPEENEVYELLQQLSSFNTLS